MRETQLDSFITPPDISYNPEHALSAPAGPAAKESTAYSPPAEAGVEDMSSELKVEIGYLEALASAVEQSVAGWTPLASVEGQDGGEEVMQARAYVQAVGTLYPNDYPRIEQFESFHSSPGGRPELLYMGQLEEMAQRIRAQMTMLTAGDLYWQAAPVSGAALSSMLDVARQDLSSSRRLRQDIILAYRVTADEVQKCLVSQIFAGYGGGGAVKVELFLDRLRAVRMALMTAYMAYSADWKSITGYVRTELSNHLSRTFLYQAQAVYCMAVEAIADPVIDFLQECDIGGCPAFEAFAGLVHKGASKVLIDAQSSAADLYQQSRQLSMVERRRTGTTSAMLAVRRFIAVIDACIAAAETALREGKFSVDRVGQALKEAGTLTQWDRQRAKQLLAETENQSQDLGIDAPGQDSSDESIHNIYDLEQPKGLQDRLGQGQQWA